MNGIKILTIIAIIYFFNNNMLFAQEEDIVTLDSQGVTEFEIADFPVEAYAKVNHNQEIYLKDGDHYIELKTTEDSKNPESTFLNFINNRVQNRKINIFSASIGTRNSETHSIHEPHQID